MVTRLCTPEPGPDWGPLKPASQNQVFRGPPATQNAPEHRGTETAACHTARVPRPSHGHQQRGGQPWPSVRGPAVRCFTRLVKQRRKETITCHGRFSVVISSLGEKDVGFRHSSLYQMKHGGSLQDSSSSSLICWRHFVCVCGGHLAVGSGELHAPGSLLSGSGAGRRLEWPADQPSMGQKGRRPPARPHGGTSSASRFISRPFQPSPD